MSKKTLESDDHDDGPDDRSPTPASGEKTGFFTVYKRGQGFYTRIGTAVCAGLLIVLVCLFAYDQTRALLADAFYHPQIVPAGATPEQASALRTANEALLSGAIRTRNYVAIGVTAVIAFGGGLLAWRLMNTPRNVNFLISTDSEMKKVNWTSREELFGSTRVVILFLFAIALVLFLIDVGTGYFFRLIGLLRF